MALSMTRPQKHPSSGYCWFRKRVPDDLRGLIGKREEHFSLGTRDPSEAKRLHASKQISRMEKWCFEMADECLMAHGLRVDEAGQRVLAGAVAAALQGASVTLASLAKGGAPLNFFATTAGQLPVVSRHPVVFKQLVDAWYSGGSRHRPC